MNGLSVKTTMLKGQVQDRMKQTILITDNVYLNK